MTFTTSVPSRLTELRAHRIIDFKGVPCISRAGIDRLYPDACLGSILRVEFDQWFEITGEIAVGPTEYAWTLTRIIPEAEFADIPITSATDTRG